MDPTCFHGILGKTVLFLSLVVMTARSCYSGFEATPTVHFSTVVDSMTDPNLERIATNAFESMIHAGVDSYQLGLTWNAIETSPKKYDVSQLEDALNSTLHLNLTTLLSLGAINTNVVSAPRDLLAFFDDTKLRGDLTWNSPEVLERYYRFLDVVLPLVVKSKVAHINVGNEVGANLLGQSEKMQNSFVDFVLQTKAYIHNFTRQHNVNITVGASLQSHTLLQSPSVPWLQAMINVSDEVPITYYGINPDFTVSDPASVNTMLPEMASILQQHGRCLYLQEIGYPAGYGNSSSTDNSTLLKQAQFFNNTFHAIDALPPALRQNFRGMSVFKIIDWTWEECQYFTKYYHFKNAGFVEYLCTLGLISDTGVEKPTLDIVRNGINRRALKLET